MAKQDPEVSRLAAQNRAAAAPFLHVSEKETGPRHFSRSLAAPFPAPPPLHKAGPLPGASGKFLGELKTPGNTGRGLGVFIPTPSEVSGPLGCDCMH